jgi:hypothetical protein
MHKIKFSASELESGIYFLRLETGRETITKQLEVIK